MQFLNQPVEFEPLAHQTIPVYAARVDAEALVGFCRAARTAGRRLVALWGSDERDRTHSDDFFLHAAFDLKEGLAWLALPISRENMNFPDLSDAFPAANRMQRAVMDMLGLPPLTGDSRPWLRHANWPVDYYPLRTNTQDVSHPAQNEEYDFVRVEGDGVHEIPVGPIHAGIIEPGHFRFSVMGENVLRLEQRLGWKHKGIERRFSQMPLSDGVRLAGRVSGDSTVAYAWAYSQAAEAIGAIVPPQRAQWLRALFLERERIINHIGDLGYLGNDVALSFGLMQFMRLKEDWVRLNSQLFGHRFMMDLVIPGGVAVDIEDVGIQAITDQCEALERELRVLKGVYDEHAGLQDRFLTTGRVTPQLAEYLGVIGLAGRASEQRWDLRSNHACSPYDRLNHNMVIEHSGDVASRALVRFGEIKESLHLIGCILRDMPQGDLRCDVRSAPNRHGFGWIEGWRGDILVALETGENGKIRRCHCHDPSWQNWPALEHAIIDNIVPDFPLINKSFNLSYAGPDL